VIDSCPLASASEPLLCQLVKLAEYYQVSADYLLGRSDESNANG